MFDLASATGAAERDFGAIIDQLDGWTACPMTAGTRLCAAWDGG